MSSTEEILKNARLRAAELRLPYAGALLPQEAYQLSQEAGARLVDVRTRAEWDWVGRIPGAVQIEWLSYPSNQVNANFLNELKQKAEPGATVMFICRSGGRSHHAAAAAARAGYEQAYNVLEGFEGDKDANEQRNSLGGWRVAGLPWIQS